MRITFLLISIALFLLGCQPSAPANASDQAKRYPFKGKVISVDKTAKKAKIDHEAIPGYMEAMAMDFPIHADWVWGDLTPGSAVHAELVVDPTAKDPYWLENIGIVAAPDPNNPIQPVEERFPQIGKPVPEFTLTNQDGKRISPRDFRGKALAITFIYRECPLPDYCIKMSQHFSDLANQLRDDAELKDKVRLLSISFDPERDDPAKLRQYGEGYLGNAAKPDFTIWQLAVGNDAEVKKIADFFGLVYKIDENNRTQIVHNLRTAVISPDGNVAKIINGNEWTPGDLLRELKATLGPNQ